MIRGNNGPEPWRSIGELERQARHPDIRLQQSQLCSLCKNVT